MGARGAVADIECVGDLPVGEALHHQGKNFLLATGEGKVWSGSRRLQFDRRRFLAARERSGDFHGAIDHLRQRAAGGMLGQPLQIVRLESGLEPRPIAIHGLPGDVVDIAAAGGKRAIDDAVEGLEHFWAAPFNP